MQTLIMITPPISEDPTDLVGKWLETNFNQVEEWLKNQASDVFRTRIEQVLRLQQSNRIEKTSTEYNNKYDNNTIANDRINRTADESIGPNNNNQFLETIKNISDEFNIEKLCFKIVQNALHFIRGHCGTIYLVKVTNTDKYLYRKLENITIESTAEDLMKFHPKNEGDTNKIGFGKSTIGTVAQCKSPICLKTAHSNGGAQFSSNNFGVVNNLVLYNSVLCLPICNGTGDIVAVVELIRTTSNYDEQYTVEELDMLKRYSTFCGIALQNAGRFKASVLEYTRNKILLNLARGIFKEQNNLECLVTKIMREAQNLLKCERCSVYLLDLDCGEHNHLEHMVKRPSKRRLPYHSESNASDRLESAHLDLAAPNIIIPLIADNLSQRECQFKIVFELRENGTETLVYRPSNIQLESSTLAQMAKHTATSGQILNINNVKTWMREQRYRQNEDTKFVHTILCMPIINGENSLIGVAQLINKDGEGSFSENDISLFEAFAIFCGLGIHNTQMYESACKLMAKQKVALECLSYHATASNDQTAKLQLEPIPSANDFNLYSFKFIDFELSDEDTCKVAIRMFLECELVQLFHIPYEVLCRWVLSVRKNYRPVKYHNWRHALNVAQAMFAMFKTGKMERFMSELEIFGLLVACLCHDLDHRGTNNAFQTKTESPLAILYTTSTMEHHHFDQCVMILNTESNNIFQSLSTDDYRKIMKVVETAILSTDLAMYFKKRNHFMELIENGEFDWQTDDKKELLSGMMMTACDISAIAKPWEVQHRIAKLVADEFFDQGDLERMQLKEQPIAMMDRERKDELPHMQVNFIDTICVPLYKVLAETFPWIEPLYVGTLENRKHWQDLVEKVEMGLTWIDHDTIDTPVETFADVDEHSDIEFTVQTLHAATVLPQTAFKPQPKLSKRQKLKNCTIL